LQSGRANLVLWLTNQASAAAARAGTRELHGGAIIAALKASGIEYVLAVPDTRDKDFRLVRVCKEDERTGIANPPSKS
jgi:hypothetical protein